MSSPASSKWQTRRKAGTQSQLPYLRESGAGRTVGEGSMGLPIGVECHWHAAFLSSRVPSQLRSKEELAMVIDIIRINAPAGPIRTSISQWQAMDLTVRVAYIREGRIEFLSGGTPVPTRDALAAMRGSA